MYTYFEFLWRRAGNIFNGKGEDYMVPKISIKVAEGLRHDTQIRVVSLLAIQRMQVYGLVRSL